MVESTLQGIHHSIHYQLIFKADFTCKASKITIESIARLQLHNGAPYQCKEQFSLAKLHFGSIQEAIKIIMLQRNSKDHNLHKLEGNFVAAVW